MDFMGDFREEGSTFGCGGVTATDEATVFVGDFGADDGLLAGCVCGCDCGFGCDCGGDCGCGCGCGFCSILTVLCIWSIISGTITSMAQPFSNARALEVAISCIPSSSRATSPR